MIHLLRSLLISSLVLAAACSRSEEGEEQEAPYESVGVLGDYEISQRGAQLRISRGESLVWETAPASVALAKTELLITDERALYTIKEEARAACAETTLSEGRQEGDREDGAIVFGWRLRR